jgi:hypothetical protein
MGTSTHVKSGNPNQKSEPVSLAWLLNFVLSHFSGAIIAGIAPLLLIVNVGAQEQTTAKNQELPCLC